LKSYPRLSEISLSCTLPGVGFYISCTSPGVRPYISYTECKTSYTPCYPPKVIVVSRFFSVIYNSACDPLLILFVYVYVCVRKIIKHRWQVNIKKSRAPSGKISIVFGLGQALSENDWNLTLGCLRFLNLDLSPVLDSISLRWMNSK
jgi:hypothetical protein